MASKGATVKLEGWVAQKPPEEGTETQTYRKLIVDAVNMLYEINRRNTTVPFKPEAIHLDLIYTAVKNRVVALMLQDQWPHWGFFDKRGKPVIRKKRWIDRRVNEAASQERGALIVAEKAGWYLPRNRGEE